MGKVGAIRRRGGWESTLSSCPSHEYISSLRVVDEMLHGCRKLECCCFFFYVVPVSWQSSSDINWQQACVFLPLPGAETVLPLALLALVKTCLQLAWVQQKPWWLDTHSLAMVWSSCMVCPVPGADTRLPICAGQKSVAGPCPKLILGWYVHTTSSVFILAVLAQAETNCLFLCQEQHLLLPL